MINFLTRFLLLIGVSLLHPLDAHAQYTFPYGRCYDRACESSPYRFTWINGNTTQENLVPNQTEWCFDVSTVPCVNSPYKCCTSLSDNLKKIVIQTRSICEKSVAQVTVNGRVKRGGIFFDQYASNNSELRITSLSGIRVPLSEPLRFCLTLKGPCQDPSTFCSRNNGPCRIAAWETVKHECCPTCTIAASSSANLIPPPDPPSPPSPPSNPDPSSSPSSPPSPPTPAPAPAPASPLPPLEILPRMQFQNCTCTCF